MGPLLHWTLSDKVGMARGVDLCFLDRTVDVQFSGVQKLLWSVMKFIQLFQLQNSKFPNVGQLWSPVVIWNYGTMPGQWRRKSYERSQPQVKMESWMHSGELGVCCKVSEKYREITNSETFCFQQWGGDHATSRKVMQTSCCFPWY